jgi:pseudouridylate synthase
MMLKYSPAVKSALDKGDAVVALESTIIAHGMPYPQNFDMAREVEQLIRDEGATPATIAIINGEMRVGLADAELEHFAKTGPSIAKVSTRDMAFVAATGKSGATTVASTMRIADMAGIRVFATGGMGGVHRGADKTFDISNDLIEFATSNVAVVTAGAKAVLDLALTLEYLETQGVPVVGYGTDQFPAFYSRTSGHKVPMRLDDPQSVARMMQKKWELGLAGGVVIANPIPAKYEIPASEIEPQIIRALSDASAQGIAGKDVTPFLLKRITELTQGRSLNANMALVMNNAIIATEIAKAYAALT